MITAEHVYSYIEYMVDEKINGIGVLERRLVRKSLKDWESELGVNFLRIGKSNIINMEYIQNCNKNSELHDGRIIKIPKMNQLRCQESYYKFCDRRMKWK